MGYGKKKELTILEQRGYICRGLLGQGAFSRVYHVESKADGRTYACKVSGNRELLGKEEAVMEKLRHPLFPECFGIWQEDGLGCLLMEYVPGSDLAEMLRRRGFSVKQTVHIGMELAEGLMYLHEREEGILFRDVKPANIMIRQDGQVKLLDFGCACAIRDGSASQAGTPGFAAPEQLAGKDGHAVQCQPATHSREATKGYLTAACDVYGLGQTLKAVLGINGHWLSGQGNREDRKNGGRLMQILDACTRQEVSERIPDMRGVMDVLMPLRGKGKRHFGRKESFFGQNVVCRKNIWESANKNS